MDGSPSSAIASAIDDRVVLHVDVDAFFCQVEVLRQPNLAGRPIAIQQHQDVISVNYAARAAGVRKHMTPAQARTVLARVGGSLVHVFCEDGHRVSYRPYREMSQALMRLMKSFPASAVVQKASIDEAYISMVQQPDSSASVATGVRLAEEIRAAARRDLGLVVSVSIAPNPLLAKLASAASKPDGLLVLCDRPDEVERLLSSTPVDRLPGVGPRLAESLRAAGYAFARELSRTSPSHLSDAVVGGVKPELAVRLVEMGSGRDATPVVDKGPAKSIQVQMTLTPTPLPAPSSRAHERPVAGGLSDRGMLMPLLVGSAECEARLRGLLRAMAGDLCSRALMDRHLEARWPGKLGLQLITHGPSGKTTSKSTAFPAAALADAPGSSGGGGGGSSGGMAGRGGDGDCSGGGGSGVGGGGGGAAGRGGDRDGGGGGGGGGSSGGGGGSNGAGTCTSGGRDECGSLGSAAAAQLPPSSAASTRLPPGSTAAAQLPPGSAAAVQLPPGSTSAELLVGERAFAPGPALLDAATAASLQMAVPQLQLHARGSAVVQVHLAATGFMALSAADASVRLITDFFSGRGADASRAQSGTGAGSGGAGAAGGEGVEGAEGGGQQLHQRAGGIGAGEGGDAPCKRPRRVGGLGGAEDDVTWQQQRQQQQQQQQGAAVGAGSSGRQQQQQQPVTMGQPAPGGQAQRQPAIAHRLEEPSSRHPPIASTSAHPGAAPSSWTLHAPPTHRAHAQGGGAPGINLPALLARLPVGPGAQAATAWAGAGEELGGALARLGLPRLLATDEAQIGGDG